MRKFDAKAKCLSRPVILEAKRRGSIRFFLTFLLSIALVACGGDSGTSVNDDNVSSSSVIQSGDSHEGSSNSKQSSSSKKGDAGKTSSSSAKTSSSSSSSSQKIASSSSTPRNDVKSSSSKRSEGDPSSSSQKIASSSSVKTVSSSSVALSSSSKQSSSSKKVESSSSSLRLSSANSSSSSKKAESSSSEYVPFDHYTCLAGNWNVHKEAYKTFIDPRNGRSYYYYTATSYKTGRSVTVMAENLNIGEMVLGENDQNDDTKMERYCYNNDTTYCDKYGGLYQWAEMMQLPSRCNTESCSDWIEARHQGICPDGWRLFTWRDYEIVKDYYDKYDEGITPGLRSQCFSGYNTSGFSLIGAGERNEDGSFSSLNQRTAWFRPEEFSSDQAHHGLVSGINNSAPTQVARELKINGFSVRCTKIE
ncbi:MAG: hypothetical protein IJM92_14340 [Fibrobacter sp.]|uniref:FISUMP domain-containing protein n=1 Tax=Fibrobacter sp. TaxID=35828 RepID=UPI0025C18756|nr:FISUMP domain-containing protein [Fibrobacter sp.]MBQ7080800.1 hypothetical protein [Fibrobacter sp.]